LTRRNVGSRGTSRRLIMRALSLMTLLLVISTAAWAQSDGSPTDRAGLREVSVPTGQSIIVGCLQGKPHNYRLTEKDGTSHLLMGQSDALSGHANHIVQLVGFKDNNRDASASSDEGTPHGLRFFRVESIASDIGSCK
jgi:hypothetical protein